MSEQEKKLWEGFKSDPKQTIESLAEKHGCSSLGYTQRALRRCYMAETGKSLPQDLSYWELQGAVLKLKENIPTKREVAQEPEETIDPSLYVLMGGSTESLSPDLIEWIHFVPSVKNLKEIRKRYRRKGDKTRIISNAIRAYFIKTDGNTPIGTHTNVRSGRVVCKLEKGLEEELRNRIQKCGDISNIVNDALEYYFSTDQQVEHLMNHGKVYVFRKKRIKRKRSWISGGWHKPKLANVSVKEMDHCSPTELEIYLPESGFSSLVDWHRIIRDYHGGHLPRLGWVYQFELQEGWGNPKKTLPDKKEETFELFKDKPDMTCKEIGKLAKKFGLSSNQLRHIWDKIGREKYGTEGFRQLRKKLQEEAQQP